MNKRGAIEDEETTRLNDLIQQQQVSPINHLDEISSLWPADDDPDLLLEYILNQRIERRQLDPESDRVI